MTLRNATRCRHNRFKNHEAGRLVMKRMARIGALVLVAAGLICLLVARAGLTWATFVHSVGGIAGWALVCFVLLTGINLACGTLKWILAMRAFAPGLECPRFSEAMLTTAIGELLGQAIPVQAAIVLARSIAGRLGVGWSARGNFGTTIYEQLFDLVVVCVAAPVGLLGLTVHPGRVGWLSILTSSILGVAALSLRLPVLLAWLASWLGRIPSAGKLKFVSGLLDAAARSNRISFHVLVRLTGLSIARYILNIMRIAVVLGALGMWIYAIPAMIGFPLVQIVGALPLSPTNLGVIEWTWSAVLVSAGAALGMAALFALTARMINVVTLFFLIMLLAGYLILLGTPLAWRWRER